MNERVSARFVSETYRQSTVFVSETYRQQSTADIFLDS